MGTNMFTQGLWKGEDPRCSYDPRRRVYYYVENTPGGCWLYRSSSLVRLGERRRMPAGFPLHAPVFVDYMNGASYHHWYAFGSNTWMCTGEDPFTDEWVCVGSLGITSWGIDHHVFQVQQPDGRGDWYLLWAGNGRKGDFGWGPESVYISRLLSPAQLAHPDALEENCVVHCRPHVAHPQPYPVPSDAPGSWKDVVAEAPFVVQKNGTVTILYSGDGAQTVHYAMGLCFYAGEGNMEAGENWIDYNASVKADPEFSFDLERGVYGPGVAAVVSSPDGREDWMYYHTKMFSTWNLQGGSEETQDSKEMWARRIQLQKIGWQEYRHSNGRVYTLPALGSPLPDGAEVPLPAGESLPNGLPWKLEAEHMLPFGNIMGEAAQRVTGNSGGINLVREICPHASYGGYCRWFDVLADGAEEGCSGLYFHNVPAARRLTLAAGSPYTGAGFELWINGRHAGDIAVPETGGFDRFAPCSLEVSIPEMATIALVYRRGKYQEAGVDYLLLE